MRPEPSVCGGRSLPRPCPGSTEALQRPELPPHAPAAQPLRRPQHPARPPDLTPSGLNAAVVSLSHPALPGTWLPFQNLPDHFAGLSPGSPLSRPVPLNVDVLCTSPWTQGPAATPRPLAAGGQPRGPPPTDGKQNEPGREGDTRSLARLSQAQDSADQWPRVMEQGYRAKRVIRSEDDEACRGERLSPGRGSRVSVGPLSCGFSPTHVSRGEAKNCHEFVSWGQVPRTGQSCRLLGVAGRHRDTFLLQPRAGHRRSPRHSMDPKSSRMWGAPQAGAHQWCGWGQAHRVLLVPREGVASVREPGLGWHTAALLMEASGLWTLRGSP